MARMGRKTEEWVNSLDRTQLLALLDRIQRAVADNLVGIFPCKQTTRELDRLLSREDSVRQIESGSRLDYMRDDYEPSE